jgi:hypothetical protein
MKVLLLDTSFAAAPIYGYLKSCGHEIWVVGNRDGDLLAKIAQGRWVQQDYSDVASINSLVSELGIERVVPGCTDVSFNTCLQLSIMSELVDDYRNYTLLSDKARFRDLCRTLEITSPSAVALDSFPRIGRFICKPVDSYSGRGCRVFDGMSADELQNATKFARNESPTGQFLIETFADGPLHSCSGFVRAGQLENPVYVIEGSSANPYAVDTSYVVNNLTENVRITLKDDLKKIICNLQLKDGLLHTQFILNNNRAVILEISRRCPGDLYPLLIEYSTGFPYTAEYCNSFLGKTQEITPKQIDRRILRHTVSADEFCVYGGLLFSETVELISYFPLASLGAELHPSQATRAGILFCEGRNDVAIKKLYESFLTRSIYRLYS